MKLLLDTNVLSEIRKRGRANPNLRSWLGSVDQASMFASVLTVGEICKGIELLRRKDREQFRVLKQWQESFVDVFGDRLLPVTMEISAIWARLQAVRSMPVIDCYLAATALAHGMQLVTRNVRDFSGTGVSLVNPFDHAPD